MAEIARYERELSAHARKKFADRRDRVKLYGKPPELERLPVFTFNLEGVASEESARHFEHANVEARVGDYYSPRLMRAIAGAAGGRAVRLSFSHYNTSGDIDRCFEVIDSVLEHPEAEPKTPTRKPCRRERLRYALQRALHRLRTLSPVISGGGDRGRSRRSGRPRNADVADVGAGTGISARLLAERGAHVIGFEPNAEMRAVAANAGLDIREARADALGLSDASVDVVASFQAFHWFANAASVAEFNRVLRPGGRIALVWNERDDNDPFTRAFGEIVDRFSRPDGAGRPPQREQLG